MPATVRISPGAHRSLAEMARETNSSLQEMLDQAIEYQRRRLLLERANRAYAKLRANDGDWKKWQAELRQLNGTLADGL
jgi:predicted transcriptional regulator